MAANQYVLSAVLLIFLAIFSHSDANSGLPVSVQECYKNTTLYERTIRIPSTYNAFAALLTKIERLREYTTDMRQLTSSLVHRFRVDGIERDPEIPSGQPGVIPFTTTGFQNSRHRLLLEKLLSGNANSFPNSSLTGEERCAMHFWLSTTVDIWERGDENTVCNSLQNFRTFNRQPRDISDDFQDPQDRELFEDNHDHDEHYPNFRSEKQTIQTLESRCPIEEGVMWTPWGSVSVGPLMASLATGLSQQNVSVNQMAFSGNAKQNFNNSGPIYNVYAAAFSGDLGEVVIIKGPKSSGQLVVGNKGGWNDTALPRHYFLDNSNDFELSDAEVRGCLDGLILGLSLSEIQSTLGSSVTLSTILDMYYSERGIPTKRHLRACQRREQMGAVASSDTLITQTRNLVPALQNYLPGASVDDENMNAYIANAVSRLQSHIPGLNDPPCVTQNQNPTPNDQLGSPAIDLVLMVDPSWMYEDAIEYLTAILREVAPHPHASTLTLYVGSSEETPMVNYTRTMLDFYGNFTQDRYRYMSGSFDVLKAFDTLKLSYSYKREDEKSRNKAGGRSQMVLFTVYTASGATDDTTRRAYQDKFRQFREQNPDVRTLFLCSGNKERFRDLVIDPQKDLFQMNAPPGYSGTPDVSDVVKRLKELPARFTNPECGAKWQGSDNNNGGNQQMDFYSDPLGITYYRLMPNYFLHSERVTVRFQATNQGRIIVCFSRSTEQPQSVGDPGQSGTSTNGVTCRSIDNTDTTEFRVEWPCDGVFHAIDCKPLYFSVYSATSKNRCVAATSGINQIDGCRYPDLARFTVHAQGLGCHSGASLMSALSVSVLMVMAVLRTIIS